MKTLIKLNAPFVHISALILALCFLPSCEKAEPPEKEPNKIVLNKKSVELLQADRQFAFELFKEIHMLSDADNLMISPLSTSYALGMTLNGAKGTTKEAFRDVLHFEDLTDQEVNESYKDLMSQLVTLDDEVQFSIANSIQCAGSIYFHQPGVF
jgi:serpin B